MTSTKRRLFGLELEGKEEETSITLKERSSQYFSRLRGKKKPKCLIETKRVEKRRADDSLNDRNECLQRFDSNYNSTQFF